MWSNVSFKACVSLLIFCLHDLSIGVIGVLKSPNIIVLLLTSPFMAVSICLIYWGAEVHLCWVHIYLQLYVFFFNWSLDHYVVSFLSHSSLYFSLFCLSIVIPGFFWFPFAWNFFSYPLIFSLNVSLGLKGVSCRKHIYGSCFHIHSASLCLLVGAFNLFTFKVTVDTHVPIAIFLIVLGYFLWVFFFSCVFCLEKFL